jgi:hypothetical protein
VEIKGGDPPAGASGCGSARKSGVGGEERPWEEEKDEPRGRDREGRRMFDEDGEVELASAISACVGVAEGEGVCAGLSGDETAPVTVLAEADDAIDGAGRGRSGLVLIVCILCDGRVINMCRQRRRWAGVPSALHALCLTQPTGA